MIEIIIKCNFDTKFAIYVSDITCLAINYIKYGVQSSRSYNMAKLADNFTNIAVEMSSNKNSIDNCRAMLKHLTTIMNDTNDDIYKNFHYLKQFNKGNCSYNITVHNPQMLKFTLFNIDRRSSEYIFVPRTNIGVTILIGICKQIIEKYESK